MASLRAFNGRYSPTQLAEIRMFGGSEVYARITANKCRGATALLRDIYFSAERPWQLQPTPDPTVRDDIMARIPELVAMEADAMRQAGQPLDPAAVAQRLAELQDAARQAALRMAREDAQKATRKLDDYLVEGGFYAALAEFLVDLPLFPYAVIKGPFVRMVSDVHWRDGEAVEEARPRLVWERVSPFDIYFTPGASSASNSDMVQRHRWSRADLNSMLDLPGWNQDQVLAALQAYDSGLRDWADPIDSERADLEEREDPNWNRSEFVDGLEYHGMVRGGALREFGLTEEDGVEDVDRSYLVQAWVCGAYFLKVKVSPSPRKRHPYFITSYEKVPGTPIGNCLADILEDIQQVSNATLRSLVNNEAMASGPQVVIHDDRFSEMEDTDTMYPWKRWHATQEPGSGAIPAVSFFQPQSNAAELLGIFQRMSEMADEVSAIPRYLTGSGTPGGAGRTASGLSMLMNNANKMQQQVASNVDLDIFEPTLQETYDLLMLTGAGEDLRGDESIVVKGASNVLAREAERARQLEFMQITANPVDAQLLGLRGRATLLRSISQGIGLDGAQLVPSEAQIEMMQRQNDTQAQAAQAQGSQTGKPADSTGPLVNTVQTRPPAQMQGA